MRRPDRPRACVELSPLIHDTNPVAGMAFVPHRRDHTILARWLPRRANLLDIAHLRPQVHAVAHLDESIIILIALIADFCSKLLARGTWLTSSHLDELVCADSRIVSVSAALRCSSESVW